MDSSVKESPLLFSEGSRKESLHNGPAVGPGAYNNLDNSDQENEGKQEGLGATKGFDETESPETGDGT